MSRTRTPATPLARVLGGVTFLVVVLGTVAVAAAVEPSAEPPGPVVDARPPWVDEHGRAIPGQAPSTVRVVGPHGRFIVDAAGRPIEVPALPPPGVDDQPGAGLAAIDGTAPSVARPYDGAVHHEATPEEQARLVEGG